MRSNGKKKYVGSIERMEGDLYKEEQSAKLWRLNMFKETFSRIYLLRLRLIYCF